MAYSFMQLTPPGSRLRRPGSSVFNPLYRQTPSPTPTPSYDQQISAFAQGNQAPQFAVGTPHANDTGGSFSFSNAGSPAFQPMAAPSFPTSAPGATAGTSLSVNVGSDPIYQQAVAAVNAANQQAEAAALGAERTNLIRYGDPNLVRSVLGDQADEDTINAARNNTFSTVAELGRWNTRALGNVDSTANRNNLFFSSTRGRDRGLQQEDYLRQQTRTGNQLQDVLTGIAQQLMGTKQAGLQQLLSAGEAAYNRQLQAALQQAYLAAMAAQPAYQYQPPAAPAAPAGTSPYIENFLGAGGLSAPTPTYGAPLSPDDIRRRRIM